MYEYKVGDLALMLGALIAASRDYSTSDRLSQPIATDEEMSNLAKVLGGLGILCRNFDADPSLLEQIKGLEQGILKKTADLRESVLHANLEAIIKGVQNNLDLRKFMYMPSEQAAYWDRADLFGYEFLSCFPTNAVVEMREAGNCFAAGRHTACVFHCIRVAEYGLRLLAKTLRVKIIDKGRTVPLEYGDWNKVIDAIRNKIKTLRQQPSGGRKEKLLQFYSASADHCEYMKDIIRNEVSHARRTYDKQEALAVINRVRDFVEPIAKRRGGRRWWEGARPKK